MKTILYLFIALVTTLPGFSQNKRIVKDYNSLRKELVTIKSGTEEYAVDIKNNWKNDTLKSKGRGAYIKLQATIDGVVSTFEDIIRKPKNFDKTTQAAIDADMTKIRSRAEDFAAFYAKGPYQSTATSESAFSFTQATMEIGLGVFNDFKKLMNGDRDDVAKRFVADSKLKKWDQL